MENWLDVVKESLRNPRWRERPVSDIMTSESEGELIWLPNHVDLPEAVRPFVETGKHQLVVCGLAEAVAFL